VGLVGLFAADLPPIYLKTLEDEADSALAMVETSMAELQTLDAEETVAQDAPELPVDPGGKPRPRPTLRPQSVARSSGTGYSTLDSYAPRGCVATGAGPAANRYALPLTFRLR